MARFDYDPEQDYSTFERMPSRLVHRTSPEGLCDSFSPTSIAKLVIPRRFIAPHDQERLGAVVDDAIKDLDPTYRYGIQHTSQKAISLLTTAEMRRIYMANFFKGHPQVTPNTFSGIAKQKAEDFNEQNPIVYARIASIAILGGDDGQVSKLFVSAMLEEGMPATLPAEREGYIDALLPAKKSNKRIRQKLVGDEVSHFSFGKTSNPEAASRLKDKLDNANLVGEWVAFLSTTMSDTIINIPALYSRSPAKAI